MGRTLPTFNTWLQEEIDSWKDFRRGLRAEQRPAFDRLFVRARKHTAEATCAARPVPFDALVMAILLEHEMELEQLSEEMAALRRERKQGPS
ncbi:MAG: hypothetical protein PWP23_2381 [Candidatus Sumerlaeota bacterium]|nr:hypothetical protein [Candidatus Sumerlaeota bacterium]